MSVGEIQYNWKIYERLLLGVATLVIWLCISMFDIPFSLPFSLRSIVGFGFYDVLIIVSYIIIFLGLPVFFPRFYILPTWILHFCLLGVSLEAIVRKMIKTNIDPEYYLKVPGSLWGPGLHPVLFVVFFMSLFFLALLYRSAKNHFRMIWNNKA